MHVLAKHIDIKKKIGYKLNIFYRRLILINQLFARTLITFDFRCRIIGVKVLVI